MTMTTPASTPRSVAAIDDDIEELACELARLISRISGTYYWERRRLHEAAEKIEANLRYRRAERKAALEGRGMPQSTGHILCERECDKCGGPMGRGPWVEEVAPGTHPRLSGRNLTDEEIGDDFWAKHPYLSGVTLSKKSYGTCSGCYEG